MQSFPTRYSQTNNTLPHQKIVPFSFKKTPSFPSGGLTINNLTHQPSSSYGVPAYYDEESHSSSGFQGSVDSNFGLNSLRNGGKMNLNRGNMADCVVWCNFSLCVQVTVTLMTISVILRTNLTNCYSWNIRHYFSIIYDCNTNQQFSGETIVKRDTIRSMCQTQEESCNLWNPFVKQCTWEWNSGLSKTVKENLETPGWNAFRNGIFR